MTRDVYSIAAALVCLDALVTDLVNSVVSWGLRTTVVLQFHGQIVVLADELVDFRLYEAILVVKHTNVILESFRLGQEVQIVIVATEINLALLLDLTLELFNNLLLLVAAVRQR